MLFREFAHPPFIWWDKNSKEWRRLLSDGEDAKIPTKEVQAIFSCWSMIQCTLKNNKMFYRFRA